MSLSVLRRVLVSPTTISSPYVRFRAYSFPSKTDMPEARRGERRRLRWWESRARVLPGARGRPVCTCVVCEWRSTWMRIETAGLNQNQGSARVCLWGRWADSASLVGVRMVPHSTAGSANCASVSSHQPAPLLNASTGLECRHLLQRLQAAVSGAPFHVAFFQGCWHRIRLARAAVGAATLARGHRHHSRAAAARHCSLAAA